MKKILTLSLTLIFSAEVCADTLNSVINKVYDKGSEKAETYLQNVLDGSGKTEVSMTLQ